MKVRRTSVIEKKKEIPVVSTHVKITVRSYPCGAIEDREYNREL